MHPMHEFEVESEAFHGSELLCWNSALDETNTMIFRVQGDPEAYRERLARREEVLDFSLSAGERGVFYCCVRERLTERDRAYVEAFARGTLVIVPPVRYNQDGTIDVNVVGASSDVEAAIDEFPNDGDASVTVISVGEYRTRAGGSTALTSRQLEAVEAALDCGYYQSPREGTVREVANRLGVSQSTAAEHLRKAEARVMPGVFDRV